jgi:hypothetical protein
MSFAFHNKYGLVGTMHQQFYSSAAKHQDLITERRLSRACNHVNQYWFPINKILLSKIHQGLYEGVYDLDIDFLISELKMDLALLLYSVRETIAHLKVNSIRIPPSASLTTIFELAGLDCLKKILAGCEQKASLHNIDLINEEQALRLQEALISASTAEVVSANYNIDPDLSYSCAIVRQLGHILISWNYAELYKKCLQNVSSTKTLDQLISTALGFSPKLLALALLNEWGLEGSMQEMLVETPSQAEGDQITHNLTKLCEIGEALARANDPEHYPSAAADWEKVKQDIELSAGTTAIKAIQARVKKNAEGYVKLFPEMFQITENIDAGSHIHTHAENLLLANNQFVKHCPPRLRKKLKNFYATLVPGEIISSALTMLVKDIIPFAGFSGGYIYTYDPALGQLIPRTKIGRQVDRTIQPVEYVKGKSSTDTIATAFACSTPIINNDEKDITSSITASIGNTGKIGVLFLETHKESVINGESNILVHFKAIRQAFNDCFHV